ncbi:MAG: hypothetical protein ACI83Y_001151 [Candidatus Azotimanducaceae bacterium]
MVVDPRRDIDQNVRNAEVASLTIELVIETHFRADGGLLRRWLSLVGGSQRAT